MRKLIVTFTIDEFEVIRIKHQVICKFIKCLYLFTSGVLTQFTNSWCQNSAYRSHTPFSSRV
jgi:hypothetical protein